MRVYTHTDFTGSKAASAEILLCFIVGTILFFLLHTGLVLVILITHLSGNMNHHYGAIYC